ncbi:MAG TPA: hypothetical protein VF211_10345 [Burkholderiales bacterium]
MPAELAPRLPLWRALGRVLRRAAEARRRIALGAGAQRYAAHRSHELLLACLSPAQRLEFERTRAFTVRGESGRRYRIGFGTVANIEVLDERGELLYRLCAKPADLPTPAVMLAQKLMLESRETEFLRIAARHPLLVQAPGWQPSASPF